MQSERRIGREMRARQRYENIYKSCLQQATTISKIDILQDDELECNLGDDVPQYFIHNGEERDSDEVLNNFIYLSYEKMEKKKNIFMQF